MSWEITTKNTRSQISNVRLQLNCCFKLRGELIQAEEKEAVVNTRPVTEVNDSKVVDEKLYNPHISGLPLLSH